ncbi:MAG: Mitochondrial inner membrane protease atp23 [Gomphillus americanus]|uniref:Mitochondrial inner membrane protease ATP23 n=1 Tax=Gomphillus americanus TaxID=1940652 RepID=A0A8H3FHL7_9LECA|nr:MAG: Mitochondrial inner membrane protease atp23 [Gomphillus americanus]
MDSDEEKLTAADTGYVPGWDFGSRWRPIIRFLREHVQKLGGDLNKDNIYCRRCDADRSGGFDQRFGIDLCANHFRNRGHVEDTLAHEMIHAWDHLRFKVRHGDLWHAACMEIRASNLSGECRFTREFFTRGQRKFTQQHQECVRRRAILSVSARPQCESIEQATKAVDDVWNSCSRDTRPFDEIYR